MFIAVLASCFALIQACDDENTNQEIVFPADGVSYAEHVQPYFLRYCATSGCHNNATVAGGLALTSWSNVISAPGVVIEGDPDASLLIQKVDGRLPHQPNVPILINNNQLEGLRTWVSEGAKNN